MRRDNCTTCKTGSIISLELSADIVTPLISIDASITLNLGKTTVCSPLCDSYTHYVNGECIEITCPNS